MTQETQEKSLAKVGPQGIEKVLRVFEIEQIEPATIKQFICEKATDQEIIMFIYTCRQLKLNPFLKQIYLIKYKEDKPAQTVISFREYLKKAHDEPNYRGYTVEEIMEGPKITGAKCTIYFKDGRVPFVWVAWMAENNKNQSTWLSQPRYQIRKCAAKQGHDLALPHLYQDFGAYEVAEPGEITDLEHPEEIKSIAQTKTDEGFYGPPADTKLENQELPLEEKPENPAKSGSNAKRDWSKFWTAATGKGYSRSDIHNWAIKQYKMEESLTELTDEQFAELCHDIDHGLIKN